MIAPAILLAALAAPSPSLGAAADLRTPQGDVTRVYAEIERLERAEDIKNAADVRALDRRAEKLAPEPVRWGRRAVEPLLAVARDGQRPPKTRLLAVSAAGLVKDPAAFLPLRALMLDASQPDALRAEAALALAGLDVSREARRQAVCAAIASPGAGRALLHEALSHARELGCDDARVLEDAAKRYGARPAPNDEPLSLLAVRGLAETFGLEAARALWRLYAFFPAGSAGREAALAALDAKRDDLRALPENENDALAALSEAAGTPNAVLATRLVGAIGTPRCVAALERALRDPDAEVVAEAAESLALAGDVRAGPALRKIVDGAIKDERFAQQPGKPDSAQLLSRIEASADVLSAPAGH